MIDTPIIEPMWTENWKDWDGKKVDGGRITKTSVFDAVKKIEPIRFGPFVDQGGTLPIMFGMGIKEIVKVMKYKMGSVLAIGQTSELAPFGLYSISYRYKNCDATSLWIDDGCAVSCIVSFQHEGRKEWDSDTKTILAAAVDQRAASTQVAQ